KAGTEQIKALIGHVSLGQLRAIVSHLTMRECIEQRESTLSDGVANALKRVVQGVTPEDGWGIALDVVQVAQVFMVDNDLRGQLEAEVRDAIQLKSQLSDIRKQEEIQQAKATSERRLRMEDMEAERERLAIAREKLQLQKQLERDQIEAEVPLRALR